MAQSQTLELTLQTRSTAGTLTMMLVSWLAGWFILTYLFHTVQDHLLRYGATQSGLGLFTPISNQGNTPQTANKQF